MSWFVTGSMGVYKYYQLYGGFPAYANTNGNGNRIYMLQGSGWLIGPQLGSPTGFIHNGNPYQCPYLIPGGWQYVNRGHWSEDKSLVVRCIQ